MTGRFPFGEPNRTASVRQVGLYAALALFLTVGLAPDDAVAQRPYRISDPFYRSETARRVFFDRYALTGEISYRSAGTVRDDGLTPASSDLALRFRFDYQLAARFDVGAIFEAVGGSGGRELGVSWIVLKYYRHIEEADYAFRLAVDPSSDGRVGFPQVDLAFLYTSLLSPLLSTDFALGVRRVNIGYAQLVPAEPLPPDGSFVMRPQAGLRATRALGTELHAMMNYNLIFDPAGSNLFVGLLGEGGQYDVLQSEIDDSGFGLRTPSSLNEVQENAEAQQAERKTPYRGGALWARAGIELQRPSYRVSPFVSVPIQQWNPDAADEGEWPQARLHVGVQLMLR